MAHEKLNAQVGRSQLIEVLQVRGEGRDVHREAEVQLSDLRLLLRSR